MFFSKRSVFSVAVAFILVGCAIPSVQYWANNAIGTSIEGLRELESLPTSYANKINRKETTYPLENGNWVFVNPIREDCSVHFEVNPQGIIVGYKTMGNNCY